MTTTTVYPPLRGVSEAQVQYATDRRDRVMTSALEVATRLVRAAQQRITVGRTDLFGRPVRPLTEEEIARETATIDRVTAALSSLTEWALRETSAARWLDCPLSDGAVRDYFTHGSFTSRTAGVVTAETLESYYADAEG